MIGDTSESQMKQNIDGLRNGGMNISWLKNLGSRDIPGPKKKIIIIKKIDI